MKFRCKQLGSHENRGAYEKFVGAFVSIRKIGLLFLCWDTCWLQSFLYYVPYACLTAMTFPAILTATESPVSAAAALVVAVAVAFAGKGLMTVAVCASVTVFLVERLLPLLSF